MCTVYRVYCGRVGSVKYAEGCWGLVFSYPSVEKMRVRSEKMKREMLEGLVAGVSVKV